MVTLSIKSREFIDNLRLYLRTRGKKEDEIDEVIGELEDHLLEAEKHGKNMDDIIGQSPGEYMQQISAEIPFDRSSVLKYGLILLVSAYSYMFLGNVIQDGIELTILDLVGYPLIFFVFIALVVGVFGYIARSQPGRTTYWILLWVLGSVPTLLFIGLILLNKFFVPTEFEFSYIGNAVTVLVCIVVFIGLAVWIRAWVPIIIPSLLYGPEVLMSFTNFSAQTQLVISSIIMYVGIVLYVWIEFVKEKSFSNNQRNVS
ncbi:HAAS domain-containing protein [Halobacillus salinus]|uniref:HAAS domain-containing protein n=1 Tax=Halobacillus salinus TaxID=192814 RepID=UPI0009A60036|nr:DUF1129 family protein [Halobacillus salinus]